MRGPTGDANIADNGQLWGQTMIEDLNLTSREKKALRSVVGNEPAGRHVNFFNRPLQGVKAIVIAALSLLGIGVGVILLWPVAAARLSRLGDFKRVDAFVQIMMFLLIYGLGREVSLLKQLVTKLYGALEQERVGKRSGS